MLEKEVFETKYETTYKQMREISFLESMSDEDRELYTDVEILTGRTLNGNFNKFINNGFNKGKKYNSVKRRLANSLLRFIDDKLEKDDEIDFWQKIWDGTADNSVKIILERVLGKVTEHIELKSESEVQVELNISQKFKKDNDKD